MTRLILINGAPGSGKSTLAARLGQATTMMLCLDIDTLRAQLGRWRQDPQRAGLAARDLAVAMIATHLHAGYDVVVPQFLARPDFVDRLAGVASEGGGEFVHVALVSSPEAAATQFEARADSTGANHADARFLQAQDGAEDVAALYRRLQAMLVTRPEVRYVAVIPGDVDATLDALAVALGAAPPQQQQPRS